MIKDKQPEKVWVDDGTEFLGAFKRLCNSLAIHLYSTFREKCFCRTEYSFTKKYHPKIS